MIGLCSAKVMVDTNVLLDIVSADRPAHDVAKAAFAAALSSSCELVAATSSLKDVYYVYARHYGKEADARRVVSLLSRTIVLCALEPRHIRMALESDEPDFEDGLVRAMAEAEGCDCILTRDAKGFIGSSARRVEPDELPGFLAAV